MGKDRFKANIKSHEAFLRNHPTEAYTLIETVFGIAT
jgi:hypothetical protein